MPKYIFRTPTHIMPIIFSPQRTSKSAFHAILIFINCNSLVFVNCIFVISPFHGIVQAAIGGILVALHCGVIPLLAYLAEHLLLMLVLLLAGGCLDVIHNRLVVCVLLWMTMLRPTDQSEQYWSLSSVVIFNFTCAIAMSVLHTTLTGYCSFHCLVDQKKGMISVLVRLGMTDDFTITTICLQRTPSYAGTPRVHMPK